MFSTSRYEVFEGETVIRKEEDDMKIELIVIKKTIRKVKHISRFKIHMGADCGRTDVVKN